MEHILLNGSNVTNKLFFYVKSLDYDRVYTMDISYIDNLACTSP